MFKMGQFQNSFLLEMRDGAKRAKFGSSIGGADLFLPGMKDHVLVDGSCFRYPCFGHGICSGR